MWVMTSFGVLMPGLRPEGKIPEGDNRTLQVRARRKKDLEILKEKYMGDELGDPISLVGTDYEWRAYCTPEAWGRALAKIGREIDYVKFKETAESKYHDKELHDLYLSLWSTIFHHLSEPDHQYSYWHGATTAVGKYGTTYQGTGNFSVGRKAKKGKNRKAGTARYDGIQDPYSYLGTRPWWADDDDYQYKDDRDDLGLGGYAEYLSRDDKSTTGDSISALLDEFDDLGADEKPVFKSANEIDHTFCDHGISKSAKKRCRARWRRYVRQRVDSTIADMVK